MAIPLDVNGAVFEYPENFDEDWGVNATGWAQAITNGTLQMQGGSFPLTADVNFGTNFGLKAKYLTSTASNPASAGVVRLANADLVEWRNFANSGNNTLGVDSSNNLTYNGSPLATTSLTFNEIYVGNASNVPTAVPMSGDATIIASGALTIANSAINNAKISASAAISLSKLATLTANKTLQSDGSGVISTSTVTSTELGYVSGVTSAIQTQLNAITPYLVPTGVMMDFAGTVAPTGWLGCDGSVVSQATYAALFAVIGSTWNTGGEGVGNFRLPDFRRRTAMGSGGTGTATIGNAVGNVGGEETHTLITSEIPSHTHTATVTDPGHTHQQVVIQTGGGATGTAEHRTDASTLLGVNDTNSNTTGITVGNSNTGGGGGHNTIQPSAIVLKIIKI